MLNRASKIIGKETKITTKNLHFSCRMQINLGTCFIFRCGMQQEYKTTQVILVKIFINSTHISYCRKSCTKNP
jgi:hypothetical protein